MAIIGDSLVELFKDTTFEPILSLNPIIVST
jgi:hypothetical protein